MDQTCIGEKLPTLLTHIEVSYRRLCGKVKALKANKSPGPDSLSPKLLKLAGDDIIPALCRLFNTSIERESLYPSWNTAKLTPYETQSLISLVRRPRRLRGTGGSGDENVGNGGRTYQNP